MGNKKLFKSIFIFLMIFVIFLFLAGYFMEVSPRQRSGNGNPAYFLVMILVILYPVVVFTVTAIFNKIKARDFSLLVTMMLTLIYVCVAYYYQKDSYFEYQKSMKQKMLDAGLSSDLVYIDNILEGFSIYLNSQFFNINTYLMYISIVLFTSSIIYLVYKKILKLIINLINR